MEYSIVYLNGNFNEIVLAQVPYEWDGTNTALARAYDLAEYLAKRMFIQPELREIKNQLFPMYWADRVSGHTISIK